MLDKEPSVDLKAPTGGGDDDDDGHKTTTCLPVSANERSPRSMKPPPASSTTTTATATATAEEKTSGSERGGSVSPVSSVASSAATTVRLHQPVHGLSRDLVDPSDDSGFSTISHPASADTRVSQGVEFVDPKLIAEEQHRQQAKIKRQDPAIAEEKQRAKEAYEREIREKQYRRLMHLLSQSKAMSNFILKKIEPKKSGAGKKRKNAAEGEDEPEQKRRRGAAKKATPPKKTRTAPKRGKQKKLNLSEEDIAEELDDMSDDETPSSSSSSKKKSNSSKSSQEETSINDIADFVHPSGFVGELRDYQKIGLNWLRVLYENGLNGILGDEMGLGKTIQVIALLSYLMMDKETAGPYLIIVPLSTLGNWAAEFERFAPKLPVVIYYGATKERPSLRPKISRRTRLSPTFTTRPVVITTYQTVIVDKSFLRNFQWRYIIIDEAQRIKNCETQLFRIVKSFDSVNRLLMTGTPLQNDLSELWSLLNFLLPEIFNNLAVFEAWFDAKNVQDAKKKEKFFQQEQEKHVLGTLREILAPFMLRRLKEDVCPELPPFKEVIVYTPLTATQYDLYAAILKRDIAMLHKTRLAEAVIPETEDGERPKRKCRDKVNLQRCYDEERAKYTQSLAELHSLKTELVDARDVVATKEDIDAWGQFTKVTEENVNYLIRLSFGNKFMMYRHVVNHPYIIHYPLNDVGLFKVDDGIVKNSGKMLVLDAMLKKLKSRGHKVLLFSNFKMVLDVLEDYLSELTDYEYVRLDGGVDYDDRNDNIDEFQKNPNCFIFLLTTRSGAVGLNLAAADTVIIYDSDWNPQMDIQAMARCHRIGQTKPVVVYRLISKGTVDEEMIRRANAKRFLEKVVISKEGDMIKTEEGLLGLKKLLETDAFTVYDAKNDVYTDAEMNEFLDRSDMVVPVQKT